MTPLSTLKVTERLLLMMIRSSLLRMRPVLLRKVRRLKRRTEKPLLISSRFIRMFLLSFFFFFFNSWENNIYSYCRPLFFGLLDVNVRPSWAFYQFFSYPSLIFLFIYLKMFFAMGCFLSLRYMFAHPPWDQFLCYDAPNPLRIN